MFDSSHPPLLVIPTAARHYTSFPSHEGYVFHPVDDDRALVCYKKGWTIPLSVQMQAIITEAPLLLVRDKGRITSSGSTTDKGYAHQFSHINGQPPEVYLQKAIFPDRPSEEWMLIRNSVTVVWLQYNSKTQYLGSLGHDMEHHYTGKLLIRDFVIKQSYAPRLDRASDVANAGEMQYRVESRTIFEHNWDLTDQDTDVYLEKVLSENDLVPFKPSVMIALNRSMQRKT